jgi:hypothetical protein
MDHSKMGREAMPGMDHSSMKHETMPGMDHSKMGHGTTPAAIPAAPASTADVARVNPGGTLSPDPFDAPSPVSVSEAAKAANNTPDGDARHVVPGEDHENPPTPQPATRAGSHGPHEEKKK